MADGDRSRARRVVRQFSADGDRGAAWRALDLFLPTAAYLNLGYSPRFVPHVLGSPQRRLAGRVGRLAAERLGDPRGVPLCDVGCGRGGPALVLASRHGFDVTGVDLVRDNVALARGNARDRGVPAAFVVGDATRLPLRDGSVGAVTAIDAPVYVDDLLGLFREATRALRPGGVAVVSDLVAAAGLDAEARAAVDAFAEAWDFAPLRSASDLRAAAAESGLTVVTVRDVTPHSVGRFRKWARLLLALAASPIAPVAGRLLAARGVDLAAVEATIRATEPALPHLRHVLLVAERPAGRPTSR